MCVIGNVCVIDNVCVVGNVCVIGNAWIRRGYVWVCVVVMPMALYIHIET